MTPVWRALSTVVALVAGFTLPLLLLVAYLGVLKVGPLAIVGLIALTGALVLLRLFTSGRLRF